LKERTMETTLKPTWPNNLKENKKYTPKKETSQAKIKFWQIVTAISLNYSYTDKKYQFVFSLPRTETSARLSY
jgi:hypothetical protein